MLIDSTYFFNRLNLPQTGNTEGLADVNAFIEQYEPEYLLCVLGQSLGSVFMEAVEGSGEVTEQRWLDLLRGANYTYDGCAKSWLGFQPLPTAYAPTRKYSPIANYVFYKYVDERITDFVLVGNVASKTDNNRIVSATDRLVDTWNRLVDMNKTLYEYLKVNKAIYPEWKDCGQYGHELYGCGCKGDRHNVCADLFKKKNTLGL